MSELTVFNEITDLLTHFVSRVGIVAKLNRHDIHVSAENVVGRLFRMVYEMGIITQKP